MLVDELSKMKPDVNQRLLDMPGSMFLGSQKTNKVSQRDIDKAEMFDQMEIGRYYFPKDVPCKHGLSATKTYLNSLALDGYIEKKKRQTDMGKLLMYRRLK